MNFERVYRLPYVREAGPLPVDHLRNGESESIDAANCQRVVQLLFNGMGVPLPRNVVLSMEAFENLGDPVLIDLENGGLSWSEMRVHARNGDVVFAELRFDKEGKPIAREEHWSKRRKKSLHMGIHVFDHVLHGHLQGGGSSFDPMPAFLDRYSVVGLRRLDLTAAPNVEGFIEFAKQRLSEQYPKGYWPH